MKQILDLISNSVNLLYFIPLVLYFYTGNLIHLQGLLGLIAMPIITEFIKYYIVGYMSVRPSGAYDCNTFANDGYQGGKPGMPSSHSGQASYFAGFYWQLTDNFYIRLALILYTLLIVMSRYYKRCHNISQIVIGLLIGLCVSYFVVRQNST